MVTKFVNRKNEIGAVGDFCGKKKVCPYNDPLSCAAEHMQNLLDQQAYNEKPKRK